VARNVALRLAAPPDSGQRALGLALGAFPHPTVEIRFLPALLQNRLASPRPCHYGAVLHTASIILSRYTHHRRHLHHRSTPPSHSPYHYHRYVTATSTVAVITVTAVTSPPPPPPRPPPSPLILPIFPPSATVEEERGRPPTPSVYLGGVCYGRGTVAQTLLYFGSSQSADSTLPAGAAVANRTEPNRTASTRP